MRTAISFLFSWDNIKQLWLEASASLVNWVLLPSLHCFLLFSKKSSSPHSKNSHFYQNFIRYTNIKWVSVRYESLTTQSISVPPDTAVHKRST